MRTSFWKSLFVGAALTGLLAGSPAVQPAYAWDSAGGNPLHATHSYLTEWGLDQLKAGAPELEAYRKYVIEGANTELHELALTSDKTKYGLDLEALRVKHKGTNEGCNDMEGWWNDALAAYKAGHKDQAYFILGIMCHMVEDMGVPAHANHVWHQGGASNFTICDNFELMATFNWKPSFAAINRTDPGFTDPWKYYAFSQDWTHTDAPTYTDRNKFSKTWLLASTAERTLVSNRQGRTANVVKWTLNSGVNAFKKGGSATSSADPLPAPAVMQGNWATIRIGHDLIPLRSNGRVLDWEPFTGGYRVWDKDLQGTGDAVLRGNWVTIRTGHKLLWVGGNQILDWEPLTGNYHVWRHDGAATSGDPFPGQPLRQGRWTTINAVHELVYLDGDRILDWQPLTGHYRLYRYDRTFAQGDPIPGNPIAEGTWATIRAGHELHYIDHDCVLDWEPATGHYRIWKFARTASGDPFPGQPVAEGTWTTIRLGHQLRYLGNDRILDWEPVTGNYHIWRVAAP